MRDRSPDGRTIRPAGQVVGTSFKADNSETRGFFHDGTTRHDLGQYSQLTAVNAGGQAVGFYYGPDPRALLWTLADGIVDLNTRLYAPPAGLRVTYAMAISDNGAIVARANTGLVLLKPRP